MVTPTKPKRITRTPDELREHILFCRVTRKELDTLYRFSRARKATMSYMVREALKEKYPDIFGDINRYIRKPKKPVEIEAPTQMLHSFVDGSVKVVDPDD